MSLSTRTLLDAAARGDVDAVDAWLRAGGDANVAGGEGWTALHYAAARGHVRVLERLADEHDVDLNTLTMTGSSALGMALAQRSNTMVRLLLVRGASRFTIPEAQLVDALSAPWMWLDVRRMLSPQWSVCWSPALHAKFPADQREKCRLVVFANTLALRRSALPRWTSLRASDSLSLPKRLVIFGAASAFGYGEVIVETVRRLKWRVLTWLGAADDSVARGVGTGSVLAHDNRSLSLSSAPSHRWIYMPPPLVYRILEFAMFLW